jgi:hypothetical protein
MTVPAWTEVQLAVGGALRLAIGDRRGLGLFDASLEGFWRSFRAALICYPFYLLFVVVRVGHAQWAAAGATTILAVETISYVVSWTAFPLLVLPLTRHLGREHRFFAFMVAYNWSQIPQTALFALVALDGAAGLLPPSATQAAGVFAAAAALVYEWYIARVALAVSIPAAMLVVVLDLLLGTALSHIAEGLY